VQTGHLAGLIAIDVIWVAGASVLTGALAPRWPSRWLARDRVPLTLRPWETTATYRRLGVPGLARRLPELGSAFGGRSKSSLPGTSPADLGSYLVEVRRAEWVHWISIGTVLPLFLFNPWWLALAFGLGAAGGNAPFIVVLRHNRLRILRIIDKGGRRT
jgi:hypothetical protein